MIRQKSYRAYLIRHGETDWNIQGKVQSHADIPLNETGEQQARALALHLEGVEFSKAYSSDLSRTRSTAQIILHKRPEIAIVESRELREAYVGDWEGRSVKEFVLWMQSQRPSMELTREQWLEYKYHPDIESMAQIYRRLHQFLSQKIDSCEGEQILVCSHGGIVMALLNCLDSQIGRHWHIANGAIVQLQVSKSHLEILGIEGIELLPSEGENELPTR